MLHMCGVLPLKPELIIEEFPILKYGSYSHCMMKGVSIPICMRKESFYSLHVGVMTVCMSIGLHARWMEFSVAWWRELRKFLPSLGLSSINYVKLKDSFVLPQSVIKPCPSQGSRCHRSDQLITVARICAAIAQTRYHLSSLHHPRSTTAAIFAAPIPPSKQNCIIRPSSPIPVSQSSTTQTKQQVRSNQEPRPNHQHRAPGGKPSRLTSHQQWSTGRISERSKESRSSTS